MKSIVLYMHVHQPYRVRNYSIFDTGHNHDYFNAPYDDRRSNEQIMHKVTEKSYIQTNKVLKQLLELHPQFKISLSITGTALEQMKDYSPRALHSFQDLVATGRVEIVGETYHHSLAFFYSQSEFEMQVQMHREVIQDLFGQQPKVFRNTELSYNNDLAKWAERSGYKAILSEGWDPILGWRSPNFVYRPTGTEHIKLLMKNYKLSDDIAFRFGDRDWKEWPLTADKFTHWLSETDNADVFNLFMDYETFGEHQWSESGIFNFLSHLPDQWLRNQDHTFMTVSEAADLHEPADEIDTPYTTTWADTERDLSAWLGNPMQHESINAIYELQAPILQSGDLQLIEDWRKLQTSDHYYYMCTKWFNDGDIHAYFSPYETPYEAYITFMNAFHDLKYRLSKMGFKV